MPLLAVVCALPKAIATAGLIRAGDERATLNQALRGTAQLHLQFGTLLALGLVVSRFIHGTG
jgi:1,4-dihydroxy-2-naphthoate octaprenyltransferase